MSKYKDIMKVSIYLLEGLWSMSAVRDFCMQGDQITPTNSTKMLNLALRSFP